MSALTLLRLGVMPSGKKNGTYKERCLYWQKVCQLTGQRSGRAYENYLKYKKLWMGD